MQNQPQVIEIAISDLIASGLRHIKQIIVFGIIFAVVLGCLQGIVELYNSRNESTNEAIAEYNRQLRDYQRSIDRSETALSNERQYLNESILMSLNPYACFVSDTTLVIGDINIPENLALAQDVTSTDYIAEKICSQYMMIWNSFDLCSELGLEKYSSTDDKYIREILSLTCEDSMLTVHAFAETEKDVKDLAEAAVGLIRSKTQDAISLSYPHTLLSASISTRSEISKEILAEQELHRDNIDTYSDTIAESNVAIKKLKKPDTPLEAVIKKAIIGGFSGLVFSCIYLILKDVFVGIMQSSSQLAAYSKLDFLGNVSEKNVHKSRTSVSIAGEQEFESIESAIAYLGQIVSSLVQDRKLFVGSTLNIPENDVIVLDIMNELKSRGINAIYGPAINTNPDSLGKMMTMEEVLLIECCGQTIIRNVAEVRMLSERMNKKLIGFIVK